MTNPLLAGLAPVHPGEILAEDVLPALKREHGVTKTVFAAHLHMTRQALENILKGQSAVTPATALRLGKLLGNGAEFWLALQADYDLRRARDQLADELEQLPTLSAA
jgi:addiction module HigA family antidote